MYLVLKRVSPPVSTAYSLQTLLLTFLVILIVSFYNQNITVSRLRVEHIQYALP